MPRPPALNLRTEPLFSGLTIAASGSLYTTAIDLRGCEGYCAAFFQVSGSGTASLHYELSLDNINWSQVTTLSGLLSAFTATSGPASDGKTYLYFNPPVAAWLRFKITETGTSNPIVVTLIFGAI